MEELVKHIVGFLVDNPDAIEVVSSEQEDSTVLELRVAKEDLGKVIGKQGRTARSIRAILTAAAGKENRKVRLEILE